MSLVGSFLSSQRTMQNEKIDLFQEVMEDEKVDLHILSFLNSISLKVVACVNRRFNRLSEITKDSQIWKPRTEIEFGKIIAEGAKQPNKSWEQTYDELSASKKARAENVEKVIQAHGKKITTDDLQYRTSRAASAAFGFLKPNPDTHHYPTGQTGSLGDRKIIVFKSTQF